jgi:hypothetical protein
MFAVLTFAAAGVHRDPVVPILFALCLCLSNRSYWRNFSSACEPRGEVGLLFAGIEKAIGVIDDGLFSAIAILVMNLRHSCSRNTWLRPDR